MAKKTEKKHTTGTTAEVVEPETSETWPRLHLGEWFDRWPDIFARRWPEAFHDMPFVESSFRMEQLVEDDGTLVVRGELPGLDADKDVTIAIDADRLTISGKREERTEEKAEGRVRSEFHYGSFQRTVTLPAGARRDDITATYEHGILEVRVPVDEATEEVTHIPVTKRT